jgi:sporulation protein YlmC with PRC-barrel domain
MVAKKYGLLRELIGKKIITNKGEELGVLGDIVIDERTGQLQNLVVQPNMENRMARQLGEKGNIQIPYKSVFAVSQMIVVDESLLV